MTLIQGSRPTRITWGQSPRYSTRLILIELRNSFETRSPWKDSWRRWENPRIQGDNIRECCNSLHAYNLIVLLCMLRSNSLRLSQLKLLNTIHCCITEVYWYSVTFLPLDAMHSADDTEMGDRLWAGKPSRYVTSQLGRLSLLPSTGR